MDDDWEILVGGIPIPHLKNMKVRWINYNIPKENGKTIHMFQTTNQYSIIGTAVPIDCPQSSLN